MWVVGVSVRVGGVMESEGAEKSGVDDEQHRGRYRGGDEEFEERETAGGAAMAGHGLHHSVPVSVLAPVSMSVLALTSNVLPCSSKDTFTVTTVSGSSVHGSDFIVQG